MAFEGYYESPEKTVSEDNQETIQRNELGDIKEHALENELKNILKAVRKHDQEDSWGDYFSYHDCDDATSIIKRLKLFGIIRPRSPTDSDWDMSPLKI